MASPLKAEVPPRQIAEILGAMALVFWRILTCPLEQLWRDWVILLAVYWVAAVVLSGKRALMPVTAAFGAALMALYLWGQIPHFLELSGSR